MTHFLLSHLAPGTPHWAIALGLTGLMLHIAGGSGAILVGGAALLVEKGERLHRLFGTLFFASMLLMTSMATALSVWLSDVGNIIGAFFAFYLVTTAWATVRNGEGRVGVIDYATFALAIGAVLGLLFLVRDMLRDPKVYDGVPLAVPFVAAAVAALAAGLDLKVILKGGIAGTARIARHVWRICSGLFIATGSFFIGQQKVMPLAVHGSPVLLLLGFAPFLFMAFWLVRIRIGARFRRTALAA